MFKWITSYCVVDLSILMLANSTISIYHRHSNFPVLFFKSKNHDSYRLFVRQTAELLACLWLPGAISDATAWWAPQRQISVRHWGRPAVSWSRLSTSTFRHQDNSAPCRIYGPLILARLSNAGSNIVIVTVFLIPGLQMFAHVWT